MVNNAWIEAMQEELHQFERLDLRDIVRQKKKEIDFEESLHRLLGWKQKLGWKCTLISQMDLLIHIIMTKSIVLRRHCMASAALYGRAKYAQGILKKHGMTLCDSIGTPMATKPLNSNFSGTPVDQTKYCSMVWALMYLTSSIPDIIHATCYCARYQARLNSDYTGCLDTRKSISSGIQFLKGDKLVSWSSKKEDCTSMSAAKAEYLTCSLKLFEKKVYGFVRQLGMRCLTPAELETLTNESA
ncbi:hypothetical protein Tco_0908715 [Tanacetum coccineum]|uniref:Reverse transcriptase n=1 Tax=Tanacetum coccineum TaxID=301880 RepID=A0ABQ5CMX8_9ASTR